MSTTQRLEIVLHEITQAENLRLSDYVARASTAEPVKESDGTMTVYLRLRQLERYSTLPRPERRSWLARTFGTRSPESSLPNSLTESANVRRVPRRTQ